MDIFCLVHNGDDLAHRHLCIWYLMLMMNFFGRLRYIFKGKEIYVYGLGSEVIVQ